VAAGHHNELDLAGSVDRNEATTTTTTNNNNNNHKVSNSMEE
jgi:hypothetical protein